MTSIPRSALAVPMTHILPGETGKPQLSRPPERLLQMLHDRADANIAHFASRTENDFHSTFGNLLSQRDPAWNPDQVRVLELDTGPLVAVVQEDVKTRSFQTFCNVLGRDPHRFVLDIYRGHHNLKRSTTRR